jgi:hypothetical protein
VAIGESDGGAGLGAGAANIGATRKPRAATTSPPRR